MFPKSQRLRNSEEINKTIKKGVNLKTPFFNVKYLKSNNSFRITVVVSKKISKIAVQRNRLKRIVRSAARKKILENNLHLKWDFVFFPFEATLCKKSIELEGSILKILNKLFNKK